MTKLTLIIALILVGTSAQAEPLCAPRSTIVFNLERNFGETHQKVDFIDEDSIMETWASEQTGTWTRFKTYTSGLACLVDEGKGWGWGS